MTSQDLQQIRRLMLPSLETRFHIDYEWWDRADRDLDIYLRSHLCSEHQQQFAELDAGVEVDFMMYPGCYHGFDDYVTPQTSLVNAVFRVFSANGNQPLTAVELGERLNRPPKTILRTLSGPRVYKGIRPVFDS